MTLKATVSVNGSLTDADLRRVDFLLPVSFPVGVWSVGWPRTAVLCGHDSSSFHPYTHSLSLDLLLLHQHHQSRPFYPAIGMWHPYCADNKVRDIATSSCVPLFLLHFSSCFHHLFKYYTIISCVCVSMLTRETPHQLLCVCVFFSFPIYFASVYLFPTASGFLWIFFLFPLLNDHISDFIYFLAVSCNGVRGCFSSGVFWRKSGWEGRYRWERNDVYKGLKLPILPVLILFPCSFYYHFYFSIPSVTKR